jgi:hypothetical protein
MFSKGEEAMKQVGGKTLVLCSSGWATEECQFFGIDQFPDIEAAQKHADLLFEMNWYRYVDSRSTLGTSILADE